LTRAEFFYYPNNVPRNRLGLDDAEALSRIERDLTTWRLEEIHAGEAPEATSGQFDLTHLKAIHAHAFQDLYEWAGVTRAEPMEIEGNTFQAAPLLYKGEESKVPFLPSHQVNKALDRTFDQLRADNYLQHLPREEFADRAAKVFSDINAVHAFMEGNGRTQREFMLQLAEHAGHPLNFDVVSGYRMGIVSEEARLGDLTGMQRMFQEISDPARVALLEQAQAELVQQGFKYDLSYSMTAIAGEHYSGIKAVHNPDTLIIQEDRQFVLVAQSGDVPPHQLRVDFTATPYPEQGTQAEQVNLKGLTLEGFAEAAAQRLTAAVQAGDLSPTQVREAAQQLAGEAERRVNLNIVTEERLSRDVQAARGGEMRGLERMFQEVAHAPTVQLMQRAIHSLELQGRDPQTLYLTVTQAGQQYEGQIEARNSRAAVIADGEGRHLITHPASLKQAVTLERGQVQFTAQDGPRHQMQMEL
jgi:cell filamentation protein